MSYFPTAPIAAAGLIAGFAVADATVVQVEAGYLGGGEWETTYKYVGTPGRLDLGGEDYSNTARWQTVGGAPQAAIIAFHFGPWPARGPAAR